MENKFLLSNEEISILQISFDMTNEEINFDVLENRIKLIKLSSVQQPENGTENIYENDLNLILENKNYEELYKMLEKAKLYLKNSFP